MFVTLGRSHTFMLIYGLEPASMVFYLPVILVESLY